MRTAAFCPGHVSCVFQPHREGDPLRSGSRGIGFCLGMGARAVVEDDDRLQITVNGRVDDASVTREALRIMGADDVMVMIETDLPVSQGFAMSAAGTVASCLAVASMRGSEPEMAFRAAHLAELKEGGGMGDVAGIMAGGVSVRTVAGFPPHGGFERLPMDGDILLAVIGPPIRTADILSDDETRDRIQRFGSGCINAFMQNPGWGSLFTHSLGFARRTGLLGSGVERAVQALEPHGQASMCMLGNSIFFRGDREAAKEILGDEVWVCGIDRHGPVVTRGGHRQ